MQKKLYRAKKKLEIAELKRIREQGDKTLLNDDINDSNNDITITTNDNNDIIITNNNNDNKDTTTTTTNDNDNDTRRLKSTKIKSVFKKYLTKIKDKKDQ